MKKWLQKLGVFLFGEPLTKLVKEMLDKQKDDIRKMLQSNSDSTGRFLDDWWKDHEQMLNCRQQEIEQSLQAIKPTDLRSLREPGMYYSDDGRFGIRCNTFPNKDIIEFGVSVPLYDDKKESAEFSYPDCETSSFASITGKLSESQIKLAKLIFETRMVAKVRIEPFAVNVTKTPAISQAVLKEAVVKAIFAFLDETQPKPEPVPSPAPPSGPIEELSNEASDIDNTDVQEAETPAVEEVPGGETGQEVKTA